MTAGTAAVGEPSAGAVAGEPGRRRALRVLAPAPDLDGPHVRLGLLWALVVAVALVLATAVVAVVVAVVAGVAAVQSARSWSRAERAHPAAAGALALAVPLAATAGPVAAIAVLVLAGGAAFALARSTGHHPARTVAGGALFGAAAASLVLARGMGFTEALALFSLIAAYDASAYLVGTGANNPWEGPAAGVAAVGAVSLAVAAVFAGVFDGVTPWVLGLVVAGLAPAGQLVAAAACGPRSVRVPAVRRLDSLVLAGPAWVALAALLTG